MFTNINCIDDLVKMAYDNEKRMSVQGDIDLYFDTNTIIQVISEAASQYDVNTLRHYYDLVAAKHQPNAVLNDIQTELDSPEMEEILDQISLFKRDVVSRVGNIIDDSLKSLESSPIRLVPGYLVDEVEIEIVTDSMVDHYIGNYGSGSPEGTVM